MSSGNPYGRFILSFSPYGRQHWAGELAPGFVAHWAALCPCLGKALPLLPEARLRLLGFKKKKPKNTITVDVLRPSDTDT